MKRLLQFAMASMMLFALSVMVGCGDKDESDGFVLVLESSAPFSYELKNYEYIVNIEAEGGEYVFRAPKNTITEISGNIYRNEQMFFTGGMNPFQNEYLTIKLENNVITIGIAPNNEETTVTYEMYVRGLESCTTIIFHQQGR